MKDRTITLTLLCVLSLLAVPCATASRRGPDSRIRARVGEYITKHSEFSHIHFKVEDAIVTLTGTVQLESQRRAVAREIRALPEVGGVRSNILLDPPAVPDEVLYPRVLDNLQSLHNPSLRASVHAGLVALAGSVRSQHDRQAAINLAQSTSGVKEVVSSLRVEENQ